LGVVLSLFGPWFGFMLTKIEMHRLIGVWKHILAQGTSSISYQQHIKSRDVTYIRYFDAQT